MYDVITIGTASRDVFLESPTLKVLKDPAHLKKLGFETGEAECFALGAKIEVLRPVIAAGGGAVNAAVTFRRQGLKTAAVVRVGVDEAGDAIVSFLKSERVTPMPIRDKKKGTAYSTILLTPGGERTILVYRGAAHDIGKKELKFKALHARWAYIVTGATPLTTLEALVLYLKRKGVKVALAPSRHHLEMGYAKLKTVMRNADVFTLNREEAALLTGADYRRERRIFRKLDEWIPGIAVMTDGRRGAYVSDGVYFYRSGIFPEKQLKDRTGAGDAFGSGFVAGLIKKNDICYALRLAAANAMSVVEAVGANTGALTARAFSQKRFQYVNLDVEPL